MGEGAGAGVDWAVASGIPKDASIQPLRSKRDSISDRVRGADDRPASGSLLGNWIFRGIGSGRGFPAEVKLIAGEPATGSPPAQPAGRQSGHFVHFNEDEAAGASYATHLGGVAAGWQGHEQRGVTTPVGLQIRLADFDGNGWKDIAVAGKSGTHILWNDGK